MSVQNNILIFNGWFIFMSNASTPLMLRVRVHHRHPLSILISVKSCGLSGRNQPGFNSLVSNLACFENICNQLHDIYAWRLYLFTRITTALSVKVSSRWTYSKMVFMLHSQSNFKAACYGNLGLRLPSLIFWSTKLIWSLKTSKTEAELKLATDTAGVFTTSTEAAMCTWTLELE